MTSLRIRAYGSSDWTTLLISGEDEEVVAEVTAQQFDSAGQHVQTFNESAGGWEDFYGL